MRILMGINGQLESIKGDTLDSVPWVLTVAMNDWQLKNTWLPFDAHQCLPESEKKWLQLCKNQLEFISADSLKKIQDPIQAQLPFLEPSDKVFLQAHKTVNTTGLKKAKQGSLRCAVLMDRLSRPAIGISLQVGAQSYNTWQHLKNLMGRWVQKEWANESLNIPIQSNFWISKSFAHWGVADLGTLPVHFQELASLYKKSLSSQAPK